MFCVDHVTPEIPWPNVMLADDIANAIKIFLGNMNFKSKI
jgi:hypothetical protein